MKNKTKISLLKYTVCLTLCFVAMLIPVLPDKCNIFTANTYAADIDGYTFENGTLTITDVYSITAANVSSVVGTDKTALKKLIITGNSKIIKNSCFLKYTALESVEITANMTKIEGYAFNGCKALKTVILPDTLSYIGANYSGACFEGCTSLESINIPPNVKDILGSTFLNCKKLKTINIPDKTTFIGKSAFQNCVSLESVSGMNKVTQISANAFDGCTSLKSINIPAAVTYLGEYAFNGCSSLKSVSVPSGITALGSFLFYGCTSLESVSLPDSVKTIGVNTFGQCEKLEKIDIPDSVSVIKSSAFSDCSLLKTIKLPESLTTLEASAFLNCNMLKEAVISENTYNALNDEAQNGFSPSIPLLLVTKSNNGSGISDLKFFASNYTLFEDGIDVESISSYPIYIFKRDYPENYIKIVKYCDSSFTKALMRYDVDLDGKKDKKDAKLALRYAAGCLKTDDLFCITSADVNEDSMFDVRDTIQILKNL